MLTLINSAVEVQQPQPGTKVSPSTTIYMFETRKHAK